MKLKFPALPQGLPLLMNMRRSGVSGFGSEEICKTNHADRCNISSSTVKVEFDLERVRVGRDPIIIISLYPKCPRVRAREKGSGSNGAEKREAHGEVRKWRKSTEQTGGQIRFPRGRARCGALHKNGGERENRATGSHSGRTRSRGQWMRSSKYAAEPKVCRVGKTEEKLRSQERLIVGQLRTWNLSSERYSERYE